MSTSDDLLNAIRADPADDFIRLMFADFAEERGEYEWAELIRL